MPPRLSVLVALVGLASLLVVARAATGGWSPDDLRRHEVVARGDIRAELSYTLHRVRPREPLASTEFRLTVTKSGRELVDDNLLKNKNALTLSPKGLGTKRSLFVADLDGDGEREVVANTVTCPGHCYFFTYIYRYVARGHEYVRTATLWPDDYTFMRLDRDATPELRTTDARFHGAFACEMCGGAPIQVWHFIRGRFVDVTRRYQTLAQADANRWRVAYKREKRQRFPEVRGILAAYVADEYVARRAAAGWRFAFAALRGGDLDPRATAPDWPVGSAYIRSLARFLVRTGYAQTARMGGIPKTSRCPSFTSNGATFSNVVTDGVNCAAVRLLLSRSTATSIRHGRPKWQSRGFLWRWKAVDGSLAYVTGRSGKSAIYASWSQRNRAKCHPDYSPCLPITDDLDCDQIDDALKPIRILGADPYRLDSDGDGLGCEKDS